MTDWSDMLTSGAAGAAKGAALGSVVPGIGTAIGAAAGGLLGVAMNVAPSVAKSLGANADLAAKATAVVEAVTGATDAAEAQMALAGDPALAASLHVQLVQLANDADAAQMADVQDARAATLALTQANSPLAYGAAIVSVIVAIGFFLCFPMLIWGPIPADGGTQAMLNQLIGVLTAGFSGTLGYWLGSSAGSARKTDLLATSR